MKISYKRYLYTIIILLLFSMQSSAVDKKSKDYGITHKRVFNNPDNCTLCHLYNNFDSTSALATKINPTKEEVDIYEYEDEGSGESSGILGWFFGRKEKEERFKPINLEPYIFQSYERSGFVNDRNIMPHEFVKSITSMCMTNECHTDKELGNSHEVDISPYDRFPDMKVPKEYPLYWDTEKYKEVISCGTCHNPHVDWLNLVPLQQLHKPIKTIDGKKYYSTFFVRVRNPKRGLFTLCKGCHLDY